MHSDYPTLRLRPLVVAGVVLQGVLEQLGADPLLDVEVCRVLQLAKKKWFYVVQCGERQCDDRQCGELLCGEVQRGKLMCAEAQCLEV